MDPRKKNTCTYFCTYLADNRRDLHVPAVFVGGLLAVDLEDVGRRKVESQEQKIAIRISKNSKQNIFLIIV